MISAADHARLLASASTLERERDFYFNKLREIESLVQTILDDDEEGVASTKIHDKDGSGVETLRKIQGIMYRTEDGFEVPPTAATNDGGVQAA